MALESATYVNQLVSTNPSGSDSISQGDDHLKLIKSVMKTSFPDVDQPASTVIVKATAPTTQVKGTIWFNTTANSLTINTAATGATPVWSAAFFNPASNTAFRVTMSAYQEIANATATIVDYDTVAINLGAAANYNTTDKKFIAPNTGYYHIKASFRIADTGGSSPHSVDDDLYIYKETSGPTHTLYASDTSYSTDGDLASYTQAYPTMTQSCIMNLTAGEKAYVKANTEGGNMRITNGTQSYFEGYQIA